MNLTYPLGATERSYLLKNIFQYKYMKVGDSEDPTKTFMRSEQVNRGTIYVKMGEYTGQDKDVWGFLLDSDMNVYRVTTGYVKYKHVIMPEDCRACGKTLKYIADTLVCDNCGSIRQSEIRFGDI